MASPKRYFILMVGTEEVGVDAAQVQELVPLRETHGIPGAPPALRGLVALRSSMLPAWDVRALLGHKTVPEEERGFVDMLQARKQDHLDWLVELRKSTEERREFRKTTDPHACAFGKWYDAYDPPNAVFAIHQLKFDAPHKRIHALGTEVRELAAQGRHGDALQLIDQAWEGDLREMLTLFDETIPMVRELSHEVVVVASVGTRMLGLIVDGVTEMCALESQLAADWTGLFTTGERCFSGFGLRGSRPVALLDLHALAQAI
jgi:chemotaxis signal transduction protein